MNIFNIIKALLMKNFVHYDSAFDSGTEGTTYYLNTAPDGRATTQIYTTCHGPLPRPLSDPSPCPSARYLAVLFQCLLQFSEEFHHGARNGRFHHVFGEHPLNVWLN